MKSSEVILAHPNSSLCLSQAWWVWSLHPPTLPSARSLHSLASARSWLASHWPVCVVVVWQKTAWQTGWPLICNWCIWQSKPYLTFMTAWMMTARRTVRFREKFNILWNEERSNVMEIQIDKQYLNIQIFNICKSKLRWQLEKKTFVFVQLRNNV